MKLGIRLWKRLPSPLRAGMHRFLQYLAKRTLPFRVGRVWRRGRPGDPGDGVELLGLARSSIGIGQGVRLFENALQALGTPVRVIDAGPWAQVPPDLELPADQGLTNSPCGGAIILSHLNPPELEIVLHASGASFLRERRHVGYWAWELPEAPRHWRSAFAYVDEVWTPSSFSAKSLRQIAPSGIAVHVVPHPIWAWSSAAPDRLGFGFPPDACVVLVALDLKSTAARKNPLGALAAYQQAAPKPSGAAKLVCKITGAHCEPALFARIEQECLSRSDIILIPEVFTGERMSALLASVDVVFSPHRAEGFGLLLAEGMRLGKAVVATGWSGNMDFMDADCAALIDYRLTPVVDPQGMYRDAQWADPDLEHAARLLAGLIRNPAERAALGERAGQQTGPTFEPNAWRQLTLNYLRS